MKYYILLIISFIIGCEYSSQNELRSVKKKFIGEYKVRKILNTNNENINSDSCSIELIMSDNEFNISSTCDCIEDIAGKWDIEMGQELGNFVFKFDKDKIVQKHSNLYMDLKCGEEVWFVFFEKKKVEEKNGNVQDTSFRKYPQSWCAISLSVSRSTF
jgi:hypothetical protein